VATRAAAVARLGELQAAIDAQAAALYGD
jgi:hypothetical protein